MVTRHALITTLAITVLTASLTGAAAAASNPTTVTQPRPGAWPTRSLDVMAQGPGDCWGPNGWNPNCAGPDPWGPGQWGPGPTGPTMMGPGGMMGPGPWGPGQWQPGWMDPTMMGPGYWDY